MNPKWLTSGHFWVIQAADPKSVAYGGIYFIEPPEVGAAVGPTGQFVYFGTNFTYPAESSGCG
jgi:hypothetical protein